MAIQSVKKPTNQLVGQSVSHQVNQAGSRLVNQSVSQSVRKLGNQLVTSLYMCKSLTFSLSVYKSLSLSNTQMD